MRDAFTRRRFVRGGAGTALGAWLAARRGAVRPAAGQPALTGTLRYQLAAGSPNEVFVAQRFIDDFFTRRHPDLTVVVEPTPDRRDELLLAAMDAGTAPDVFDTWRDDVVKYADRDKVLDLEPLVTRDLPPEEVADYFPWQWADFRLPGGLRFGMPKYVNLSVVWYNRDRFERAGIAPPDDTWDHDRYAEAARALTIREGARTPTYGLFYPAFALDRFSYKLEAWGGRLVDPDDPTRAAFDGDESLAAAAWAHGLTFADGANARPRDLFPEGRGGVAATIEAFVAGKVAMVEDGLYPFPIAEGVKGAFSWGFAAVPKGPVRRTALGTADGFAIWSGSRNAEAAWELVKFLSGPDYQLELTVLTGYLPNRFSILQGWRGIGERFYPELAEADLDVATRAMAEGYPGNRPLFARDSAAQALLNPALDEIFVANTKPVEHLVEVATAVTNAMRA